VIDVLDRLPGTHLSRGDVLRQQLRLATRDPLARAGDSATTGPARELLAGRRADLAASSMITADVDGDPRPEVLTLEGGELITRSGDGRRIIARRAAPGLTELRCAGRDAAGAWAVAAPSLRSPTWQILDLAGGAPPASLDGIVHGPRGHCLWSDLDGDQRNELYLVVDHGLARVTQDAPPGQVPSLAAPWRVHVERHRPCQQASQGPHHHHRRPHRVRARAAGLPGEPPGGGDPHALVQRRAARRAPRGPRHHPGR
jgi:hypothetical protein